MIIPFIFIRLRTTLEDISEFLVNLDQEKMFHGSVHRMDRNEQVSVVDHLEEDRITCESLRS